MRALLLYPEFPLSYWSFDGVMELVDRKAFMPPLSLITVAALLPQHWQFRLVDCNTHTIDEQDWQWAEIVLISGMMVQKEHFLELIAQARSRNKTVAVGGPYVSSMPDIFEQAQADYIVMGEGEVSIPMFLEALEQDQQGPCRIDPGDQKADMSTSPTPRYDLLELDVYSDMAMQFSRGCPFLCEFCDIITLYGRKPRTKTPEQIIAELQCLYDLGWRGSLFVVDDNFIGNKRQVKPLLEAMIQWQQANQFPYPLSTEASVNLAEDKELMKMMVDAGFIVVFLGIETPDTDSLAKTRKNQNLRQPLVEQVRAITQSGMRVMGGFIIGFDGEEKGADQRIIDFANEAAIPHVIVSTLQALPVTHLSDRLKEEGRLYEQAEHATMNSTCLSNFVPTRPLKDLADELMNCTWQLYDPVNYMKRSFDHCMNLGPKPKRKRQLDLKRIFRELPVLFAVIWRQGIKRSTRKTFWGYLLRMKRENPKAFLPFMTCCAHYEHFWIYRQRLMKDVRAQLATIPEQQLNAVAVTTADQAKAEPVQLVDVQDSEASLKRA